MPRSKTVARNRPFPADDPAWPRARKAQLRRTVLKRMAKLWASDAARGAAAAAAAESGGDGAPAGPAAREEPCEADANTPSMPR